MKTSIPVYHADGSLRGRVNAGQLALLQSYGLVARVVCHRKGYINRAILVQDRTPKPTSLGAYVGSRYSFQEVLEHGHAWELKHLDGTRQGASYAPEAVRPWFVQVISDCLTTGEPQLGRLSVVRSNKTGR
jgi:hypothetical protein